MTNQKNSLIRTAGWLCDRACRYWAFNIILQLNEGELPALLRSRCENRKSDDRGVAAGDQRSKMVSGLGRPETGMNYM